MENSELLKRIKEGDKEAFEMLYREYHKQVYSIAYRYTGNREDAEDITVDVFVKVWQKVKGFRGESSLSTWIYRIAVNTVLDYKRRVNLSTVELSDDLQAGDKEDSREYEVIVQRALDHLPPAQRMAIILTQIEGYSYADASRIMKKSVRAIESLVQRGKSNLKRLISPIIRDNL